MITITASQVKSFKNCRRRYFFEYVELLRPTRTPFALDFGTVYHIGVAALLKGKPWMEEVQAYLDEKSDLEPVQGLVAIAAIQAFEDDETWRGWEVCEVEREFEFKVDKHTILVGKMDLIVKAAGVKWVLDHKTAVKVDAHYFGHLMWDDQASAYTLAAVDEDPEIAGILYAVIQKPTMKQALATPEEERKYVKKTGELYANQRELDETDEEYVERVADWYAEKPRIHFHPVRRNPDQLEAFRRELSAIAEEIDAANHLDRFYPNPRACEIMACPFASICLEYTPEAIEGMFDRKTKMNEELKGSTNPA